MISAPASSNSGHILLHRKAINFQLGIIRISKKKEKRLSEEGRNKIAAFPFIIINHERRRIIIAMFTYIH